jgi:hypothetical protein
LLTSSSRCVLDPDPLTVQAVLSPFNSKKSRAKAGKKKSAMKGKRRKHAPVEDDEDGSEDVEMEEGWENEDERDQDDTEEESEEEAELRAARLTNILYGYVSISASLALSRKGWRRGGRADHPSF